jgi:threonine/homoserine/homoserine lactone efflux protein
MAAWSVAHAAPVGSVATLVLASLAIMGSPGPSTISLVAVTVAYGIRRALAYCAGLVVGATIVLLAVAAGVTAVLLALPALRWALLLVATAYILWLAYRLATAPPLAEQNASDRRPTFLGGAVLGVVNPKAWIAIGAVFASGRLADTAVADALLKLPLLTSMVVVIHVMWLLAGKLLMPVVRHPRHARAVNITLAVLLVTSSTLAFVR